MSKFTISVLGILGIICIAVAIAAGAVWNSFSEPVSTDASTVLFDVQSGEGVSMIAGNLVEAGLVKSSRIFSLYVKLDGSEKEFVAGTYELSTSLSVREIVNILTQGEVSDEQEAKIIEGWTAKNIADYLEDRGILTSQEFLLAVQTTDIQKLIPGAQYAFLTDKPAEASLEGYLFPDTYRFFKESRADQIVQRMLDNFEKKVTTNMMEQFAEQGLSTYQAVTLASIVEKEVRTPEERRIAAGIFLNRISLGIPLQSDATVNYVTGKQALQPTAQDLEADSLYNTYQVRGLPPGPISNPSLTSLQAVASPAQSDYLYFLTKPDGTAVFSVTYEEHLANKRAYLE